jgi:hypothetical protein
MQYECMMLYNMSVLYVLTKRKSLLNIDGIRVVSDKVTLIPVVSSNEIIIHKRGQRSCRRTQYTYTYISIYPPSGSHAFNASWTTLYTLRECIHVLHKQPQDIPSSSCTWCAVVTRRTMDTQPLSHDRDCPQANLVLRGRFQDLHHPAGGYLPSYLDVGVSLQKSKYKK